MSVNLQEYLPICQCGATMVAVWFTEKEYRKGYPTGRKRKNISHFECPNCFKRECVDDSFASEWK